MAFLHFIALATLALGVMVGPPMGESDGFTPLDFMFFSSATLGVVLFPVFYFIVLRKRKTQPSTILTRIIGSFLFIAGGAELFVVAWILNIILSII